MVAERSDIRPRQVCQLHLADCWQDVVLQVAAISSQCGKFRWRIITAPQLARLEPNGGGICNGDGNAIGNVATFSDFHSGGIAEGDCLFAGWKCLYMTLPAGLIIDYPSFAGFAIRLFPATLSDCHLIYPPVRHECDMGAIYPRNKGVSRGIVIPIVARRRTSR